jgi:hypothetical protein
MSPLVGIFGLGPAEVIVLAILFGGPLLVAALVIVIVLVATRKPRDPENE